MIISKKKLKELSYDRKEKLLECLYEIEDLLDYDCKNISNTIEYLQNNTVKENINNLSIFDYIDE